MAPLALIVQHAVHVLLREVRMGAMDETALLVHQACPVGMEEMALRGQVRTRKESLVPLDQ